MGRRSKTELFGLIERVFHMYNNEKRPLGEIEEILRSEGYDISRESIRRSVKDSKQMASQLKKSMEEARVMIDTVRENPNTDLVEAAVAHLGGLIYKETSTFDEVRFDDPMQAVNAVGKLANAQTRIARLRLDYQKGAEAAKNAVKEALRKELEGHPDLLERLTSIVSGIEVED